LRLWVGIDGSDVCTSINQRYRKLTVAATDIEHFEVRFGPIAAAR